MDEVRIWLPLMEKGMEMRFWKDHKLPGVPRPDDDVLLTDSVTLPLKVNRVWWSLGKPARAHVELTTLMQTVHSSSSILRGAGWELEDSSQ